MIDDPFSFYKLMKRTCIWAVSTIRLLLHWAFEQKMPTYWKQ
jgi:hypothetical protein